MRREHASHDGLRMPAWIRRWVYFAGGACSLTGVLWLLFHHFVRHEGEFGPQAHLLEPIWLTLHGGAALAMAWVFGLIWLAHVRRGWQRGRNRTSGATMTTSLLVLGLSGWGLYYLGDEAWREAASLLHWSLGLGATGWLPFHVWCGRRSSRC
jgi:hypothetical protein